MFEEMAIIEALVCVVVCTWLAANLLRWQMPPAMPHLSSGDKKFCDSLILYCPHLMEPYVPTPLWGLSGHIQTFVHSLVGRVRTVNRESVRRSTLLADGATLTWDEWQPLDQRPTSDCITIAICPGIGNSSETDYIWSFVHYACVHGYRCIALNHLGALKSVALTAPRIFSYGRTDELDVMLKEHATLYPLSQIILVGFSMGGNIVTKYMAQRNGQGQSSGQGAAHILGAIAICQGFDARRCVEALKGWQGLRKLYMQCMTRNMKRVVNRHRDVLLADDVKTRYNIDEARVLGAAELNDFDEAYTRRVNGYETLTDLYRDVSSIHFLDRIELPMVFINARDDPLVPPAVLDDVRRHCSTRRNTLLIETEHGGHLGFYEGGFLIPHSITWLDRTVVDIANGLAKRG